MWWTTINMPEQFKMGADPEFSFIFGNKRIHAAQLLSKLNNGSYRCDKGELGYDGASATAEIRPKPELDPAVLTEDIGVLLKKAHDFIPQLVS